MAGPKPKRPGDPGYRWDSDTTTTKPKLPGDPGYRWESSSPTDESSIGATPGFPTRVGRQLVHQAQGLVDFLPNAVMSASRALSPTQGEVNKVRGLIGMQPSEGDGSLPTGVERLEAVRNTAMLPAIAALPGGPIARSLIGAGFGALSAPDDPLAGATAGLIGGEGLFRAGRMAGPTPAPRVPTATEARIAAAKASSAPITMAQATDAMGTRLLEGIVAHTPTGKLVTTPFAQRQAAALGTEAERLATKLTNGEPVPSAEQAGTILIDAAKDMGNRLEQQRLPIAAELGKTIDAAHPDGVPLPGIEALIERWSDPNRKITTEHAKEIEPVLQRAIDLVNDAKAGRVTAAELLNRRTALGQDANFSPNPGMAKPDRTTTPTRELWSALREDLTEATQAADAGTGAKKAQDALAAHDDLVQTFRQGGRQSRADFWNRVANTTPERAVRDLMRQPSDALAATQRELTPAEYQAVAARHFADLGKARPGGQSMAGDVFSPQVFKTEWNKMTPEQRAVAWPGLDPTDFVTTVEAVSKNALPNPSGTAGAVLGASALTRALESLAPAIGTAQGVGVGAGMATGNPLATGLGILGPSAIAGATTWQPAVRARGLLSRNYPSIGESVGLLQGWR